MPAKRISVKAVEGRVARVSPVGEFIPSDRFVSVPVTPYVERLIRAHGDLVVEPAQRREPKPAITENKEAK